MDELIDVHQVAKQAGDSIKTLPSWIAQARIETMMCGDRWT